MTIPLRILLVEDDRQLGRSFERALRKAGYIVAWAQTIQEATWGLDTGCVDVMICDRDLGKDGEAWTWAKTQAPRVKRLVLMTGGMPEGEEVYFRKGAEDMKRLIAMVEGRT